MILADENIDSAIVSILRSNGIETVHIKEYSPGVTDEEVIRISKKPLRIILTEDKDFGEWAYAHQNKDISVILLRYHIRDTQKIIEMLLNLLAAKGNDLFGKFVTINSQKIRIRSLK